ncbi:lamin tail domain-containing protein [bacterium]|nr:lamin tail domain-containing protein [bacterium]
MNVKKAILLGALGLLLATTAWADVIPISDVNADDVNDNPVLDGEIVTVEGVVTVGTGSFAATNDIFVQDATGGVFVSQENVAFPSVSPGDSVRITGKVGVVWFKRTRLKVGASVSGSEIVLLSTGNPVPTPTEVTARDLATAGEDYEGSYVVMRDAHLQFPTQWPSEECDNYKELTLADDDTSTILMLHPYTDICGSTDPLDRFDVFGVVIPDPTQTRHGNYGIMPPSRGDVRSLGSGAGIAATDADWFFAGEETDFEILLIGEADPLTRIAVTVPAGWTFSGDSADVDLEGAAFATASVVVDSTNANVVTVSRANLVHGSAGSVTLENLTVPMTAGDYEFGVATAIVGEGLVTLSLGVEVHVATTGDPGSVVINELYGNSNVTADVGEYIELMNTLSTSIDISGWVLADLDDSGVCGGVNLWEFPIGSEIGAGEAIIVARHAIGFYMCFGTDPDYELRDLDYGQDPDNTEVPNLLLVSPDDDDSNTSQEIILMGGADESGYIIGTTRVYEAVYLYTDRIKSELVDAVEYRDIAYLASDHCTGDGLGGPADAWTPGFIPTDYSLGRDAASTDTDDCSVDLLLSSYPTPGEVNNVADDDAPTVVSVAATGDRFAKVTFSEPLDRDSAESASSYALDGDADVLGAWLSDDMRNVLLHTSVQATSFAYTLSIEGVKDLAQNEMVPGAVGFVGHYQSSTPISEIQAYDEDGLSPLLGQAVTVLAFITVPPGVFQPDRTNIFVQDLSGGGVNAYDGDLLPSPPGMGDLVEITAEVEEYVSGDGNGATTELTAGAVPFTLTTHARGFNVIEPAVMRTGEMSEEEFEGTYMRTSGVIISLEGFAMYIDDGSGSIQVYQNFTDLDFSGYALGDSIEVTGVLLQYDYSAPYFDGYELAPRHPSDLVTLTSHFDDNAKITTEARVLNVDEDDTIDIRYNGPKASHIAVRVFDLQGRSVATLYDGWCLGPQRTTWDGRDDEGRKVAPGVYVCHVQARPRAGGEVVEDAAPIVVGMKLR